MAVAGSIDHRISKAADRTPGCLSLLVLEAIADMAHGAADPEFVRHLESCAYCHDKLTGIQEFEARRPRADQQGADGPPQCLPLLVLESLADNPADFPKASMAQRHIQSCSSCSDKLAMLREFETRRARQSRVRFPDPRGYLGRLALVAASLVLAVGFGLRLRQKVEVEPPHALVYRSIQFSAISPAGPQSNAPQVFRWEPVTGAAAYRIHLMEVDRTEIWSLETNDAAAQVPAELRRKMSAGRAFLWRVEARSSAGENIAETNLQKFYIDIVKRPLPGQVE